MEPNYVLFWDGPLSQWEPCIFELDDVEYNCAEQYMMAAKAALFEDEAALEEILDAEDPRTQKEIGRRVEDFDIDVWQEDEDNGRPRCWNIVWRGNMAKFSQNPHLLDYLLATGERGIAEASPYDRIWGIGLRVGNPRAQNRENWEGTNWLGEVLESVRSFLRADPRPYTSTDDSRQPL